MATPSGHTLYWIYIYYADGAYNFSTAKTVSEAKQTAKDFAGEGVPYSSIYIFYGNQDGAFTDHDAYSSRTPSSGGRRKKTTKRKRSYASRSKSGGAKRRTLTRLRHVRAVKRRGHGVMRSGVTPRTYTKGGNEKFTASAFGHRGNALGKWTAPSIVGAMTQANESAPVGVEVTIRGEFTSDGTHHGLGKGRVVAVRENGRWIYM
jgi:hypothetical protein